jgi:hypothetical protein
MCIYVQNLATVLLFVCCSNIFMMFYESKASLHQQSSQCILCSYWQKYAMMNAVSSTPMADFTLADVYCIGISSTMHAP